MLGWKFKMLCKDFDPSGIFQNCQKHAIFGSVLTLIALVDSGSQRLHITKVVDEEKNPRETYTIWVPDGSWNLGPSLSFGIRSKALTVKKLWQFKVFSAKNAGKCGSNKRKDGFCFQ